MPDPYAKRNSPRGHVSVSAMVDAAWSSPTVSIIPMMILRLTVSYNTAYRTGSESNRIRIAILDEQAEYEAWLADSGTNSVTRPTDQLLVRRRGLHLEFELS